MQEVTFEEYINSLSKLQRAGIGNVKAFYNHGTKTLCKDPRSLLIPIEDHLVHRGDGVFESIRCSQGLIFQIDKHLGRLENSLATISLALPCTLEELREYIIETAAAGNFEEGTIKVLIGRGLGGFGVDPAECPEASLMIIASSSKPKPESFWENGLTAARSTVPVKQAYLARIKSTNYLPNVLMTQEAHNLGVDLVFSFDENNHLAEAAIANVAVFHDNTLLFPKLDFILPGTTALLALEVAKSMCDVKLTDITENILFNASEIMVLGTTAECVGVTQYGGKPVGSGKVGPFTKKLRQALRAELYDKGTPYLKP